MIPFRLRYRFNRKQILVVRHIFSENKMNEQGYRVSELYTGKDKGIYGKLYRPEGTGKKPLLIFSHELFCTHTTGDDYARLEGMYGSGHGFSGGTLKKACLLIKEMIER